MSKKLLTCAAVLLAALVAVTAVAAWRIQDIAVGCKPLIQEKLSIALGAPVTIGRISASLFPQPALEVFDVKSGAPSVGAESITAAGLSARAALLPLLSGRLILSSITVQSPNITIVRGARGTELHESTVSPQPKAASAPKREPQTESRPIPLDVQINQITITKGILTVRNAADRKDFFFDNIELNSEVKLVGTLLSIPTAKLSLTDPHKNRLEVSANQCSFDSSTRATSCASLTASNRAGLLAFSGDYSAAEGNGSLRVAGERLSLQQLQETLAPYQPVFKDLGLSGSASIALDLEFRSFRPLVKSGEISLADLQAKPANSLHLTRGSGEIEVTGPLDDVTLQTSSLRVLYNGEPLEISSKMRIQPSRLTLETLSVQGFRGNAELPSVITIHPKPLSLSGRHTAANLSLPVLLKAIRPDLKGILTGTLASLRSEITSLIPAHPERVEAKVEIVLKDGALVGFNLPSQVMTQISGLPFISDSLRRKIPPEFEKFFSQPDTIIRELVLTSSVIGGLASLSRLSLASDLFDLTGTGTYSLRGELALNCELVFERGFSRALIEKVPELKGLANSSDRLVVPLMIKGKAPSILVLPDLAQIAGKTSVAALQKVLQEGLKGRKGLGKGLGKDLKKVFGF